MGLWDRLFGRELRAEVITADDHIMRILKGIEITPETALEIPAVSACVAFISSCIAGLPVKLYRENRNENSTEEIKDDVRLRLLNDETGDLLDPFQMKQAVVNDYFLYGGGFIYPEMNGNEFVSLRYIKHGAITSFLSGDDPIFKVGEYVLSNGMRLRDDEVVRLLRDTKDGLTGESVVIQHQQLLSAMYREIVYEKLLVSSGGNKKGFLTSESKMTPEMLADLRQKWQEMYANTGNNMMILNKGITFHESSNTSVEMQLNENKARNNALVCQLFGMSPEAVSGQLGEDALAAVIKGAVVPVITAFEAALNRGLLLPSERDWMYFVFDTTELLKGDILKRYQAYKTGLECNVLQIDEARYKEDLPPLGLNWIKLGLQDVLYDPKTKTIYTPNMNQSMTMSENKVSFGENAVDNGGSDGIMEKRGWGTINGRHVFIGDDGGGGGNGAGGSLSGAAIEPLSDSADEFHAVTDEAIDSIPQITVFDNAALNQEVHTGCVDVLKAVKDAPPGTEAIVSISLDAKHKSNVLIGEPGAGDIDPIRMDVPYVSIHNHASGETFSIADLMMFHDDKNCKSIVVIGNNSNLYILKKSTNFNSTDFFEYCMKKHLGFTSYNSEDDFIQGAGVYGTSYYKRTN